MHSPVNCSKVLAVDIALICQKARYKCTQNSYSIKVKLHFTDPIFPCHVEVAIYQNISVRTHCLRIT